ncbi:MAG: acyl-CoA dehydrogenase family protein [Actinomycetes bacterium]
MTTVDQTGFFQDGPRLRDEWTEDTAFRRMLARVLPADVLAGIEPDLAEMGVLAATTLKDHADALDTAAHEPRLVRFDAWGRRVDRIETSPHWDAIGRVAAEKGVVAAGYEGTWGEHARTHQFALAYLFAPSSGLYSCPLAMTDGAARTIRVHGDDDLLERAFPRLTSRDPERMWTSGQWMTERTGGSDVGISQTRAVEEDGVWRLHGTKWFTSAITADMALTLARPEGNPDGGRGLAMFYVEVRDDAGDLNHIRVLRLKDKLGTRQMPTAELALEGTVAHLVGGPADGTRNITPMLAVTRLWNAVSSAAGMRRATALARDYATRRVAFGRALVDQPLHQATLAWMQAETEAATQLTFRTVGLLGREEHGVATEEELRLLRMLLPLAKLTTGKQAVAVASEALESFGGAGYIEDTHLPVLLRDAQVLPIWEGTTNVLSLDALRALQRDDALGATVREVHRAAGAASHPRLTKVAGQAVAAADHAAQWVLAGMEGPGIEAVQHGARRFALTLGRALQAALLVEQAQHDLDLDGDGRGVAVAERFASSPIDLLEEPGAAAAADAALARDVRLDLPG